MTTRRNLGNLEGFSPVDLRLPWHPICNEFQSVFEESEVGKNQTVSWQPFFSRWGQFKAVGR